jgi:hypothetical protein
MLVEKKILRISNRGLNISGYLFKMLYLLEGQVDDELVARVVSIVACVTIFVIDLKIGTLFSYKGKKGLLLE